MKTSLFNSHLETTCKASWKCDGSCDDAVRMAPTGRWFITMGHPGFNSPANNKFGYDTKAKAVAKINYYVNRQRRLTLGGK